MGWQRSSVISMVKIYSRRERSFCFVGSVPIGAKDFCGWEPDFYFCISNMARSGMNPKALQYLMGHSDIGVTLNTYTHLGLEDAKVEMRRIASVS